MTDLKAIKQIENILNVKLVKLDKIRSNSKGYTLNQNGEVTGLGLSYCNIKNLDRIISPLKELTNLTELNLRGNQLSDISPLKDLTNLTNLNLSSNQLSVISPLKELTNLTTLDLNNTHLKSITFLKKLINLKVLNLTSNKIYKIDSLKNLTNLVDVRLGNNNVNDISPIKSLKMLSNLYLWNNKIQDINQLKDLKILTSLDLMGNPLTKIKHWIVDFDMEIQWDWRPMKSGFITFYDNPLKSPPPEIIQQGKEAIKAYFKSLEEGKAIKLSETRILLVGDGMAGKTSLLKQIQGLPFCQKESQTHGINVVTLPASKIEGLGDICNIEDCQLHFWDFGGQEIMHASHQFFLSERCLYVLVLDSRTDSKKYYWLKHIQKYGGDSPVIVVMNKIDENPGYNIEQKKINEAFPNISNRFFRVSCKNGEGVTEFLSCLGKTIPNTSLFGTVISEDWVSIKDRLIKETAANNYINRDQFVQICIENNVPDEAIQNILLKFLHYLGVVLFFEQLKLKSIYVLDPHWVTIGVYKIINSQKTKDGILKEGDLDYILNEEEIKKEEYDPAKEKKITYSSEEQLYIINIMMQFELCYQYDDKKGYYIIPDLLPKELEKEPDLNEGVPLRFIMEYDYLPAPIISRLMIRLKGDIVKDQQWKYGMILENTAFNCKAKVKSDEQTRTIEIAVQGELRCKRNYFSVIRHNLGDINRSFENLKIEEYIPLPGYPDYRVKYQSLLGHERKGRTEYFDGELEKEFSVEEMLDSVISKEERAKQEHGRGVPMKDDRPINISVVQTQTVNQKEDEPKEEEKKPWYNTSIARITALVILIGALLGLVVYIFDILEKWPF